MKKFLSHIVLFCILVFGLLSVTFAVCYQRSAKRINWAIESNKTILIAGDSYPECAVNDSIISNAINICSSADAYIYSFVKIRKFIENNPQIQTVLLGFSCHNLQSRNDSFFKYASPGISKFVRYFYLMDGSEIQDIFKANYNIPIKGFGSCFQKAVIFALTSVGNLSYKRMNLGGYRRLTIHQINKKPIKSSKSDGNNPVHLESSSAQIHYLMEIIQLCKKKRIRLILISTPINREFKKMLEQDQIYFNKYCKQNGLNGLIWNYSDFSMPDSCYADPEHLNEHGAVVFSMMIRDKLLKN
jgi:hypothetical protein